MPAIMIMVGDPEHLLRLSLSRTQYEELIDTTDRERAARRGPPTQACVLHGNDPSASTPVDSQFQAMGRDFRLGVAVATLAIITGIQPIEVVPFGHIIDGLPVANLTRSDRTRGVFIPDHRTLMSYLEPPPRRRTRFLPLSWASVTNTYTNISTASTTLTTSNSLRF